MISDMTKGDTYKVLFRFSLIIAAGNMLQQLYNLADVYIVGRYAGVDAMAAIGSASNSVLLLMNIAVGLNMGLNVVIANAFGKKDMALVKRRIATGVIIAVTLGIIFAIFGIIFSRRILIATHTPYLLLEDAQIYLRIYFSGLIFLFLFNIIIAISQALGDSRTTFYSLIVSCLINIVLDIFFIKYLHLGVKGAAIATIFSEIICFLWGLILITKLLKQIKGNEKYLYDKKEQIIIINESLPAILQRSVIAIGVTLMQSLINQYGVNVMAGYVAATKVFGLVSMPVMDIGNAVSTFTAQNIGADEKERVKEGINAAILIDLLLSAFILLLVYGFGEQIISFFISNNSNTEAISFGLRYIRITCLFQIIQGVLQVYNGAIRGAADVKGFMSSYVINLFCRVSFGYLLSVFGLRYIPYAWPIGWAVGLAIGYWRYVGIFKEQKQLAN